MLSYQCQELSASDSSDTATPGPADTKQKDFNFVSLVGTEVFGQDPLLAYIDHLHI